MEIGYKLSSEEHSSSDLVEYAEKAENSGFELAFISDHFHPWTRQQGESPHVWTTLGGIAQVTDEMEIGTGVTCPTFRNSPAIMAQAAATTAEMMPSRFSFNVGTGERLNEHIHGDYWPPHAIRSEMLEEAVEIIRELWTGEKLTYYGNYYEIDNARVFTLPDRLPPINVAASGPRAARLAGSIGDGLVSTAPKQEIVDTFEENGGSGPKYAEITVCHAENEENALDTAKKFWPNGAIKGELGQQLSMPAHFEQAAQMVRDDDIRNSYVLGSDPSDFIDMIQKYQEAGFDKVILHHIGPDQEKFMEFARESILGRF